MMVSFLFLFTKVGDNYLIANRYSQNHIVTISKSQGRDMSNVRYVIEWAMVVPRR